MSVEEVGEVEVSEVGSLEFSNRAGDYVLKFKRLVEQGQRVCQQEVEKENQQKIQ